MMYKIISIDPFFNNTDELSVKLIDVASFEKTAASLGSHVPEEIVACIKGLEKQPDSVYAHVIAVSADEYYGSNRNADAFKEKDLLGVQDEFEASKNPLPYTGVQLPRYKTFLSAKFFKHHINKDPNNSFGDVVCAAYNMKMHRVELVIRSDIKKDPDFAADLLAGNPIPLSMGCKVPFDVCSICGKVSKSRAEYCQHMKEMPNKILEDGRQVKVYNTKPRFHDISRVLIPADEQAFTLKKVASHGVTIGYDPREYVEKEGMEVKAEIDKKVPGNTIGDAVKNVNSRLMSEMSNGEPDIKDEDLKRLSDFPLKDILSTSTGMGVVLKPHEHRRIIIIKISRDPSFLEKDASIDVDLRNRSVYNILSPYAADRSCYTDYIVKRASVLSNSNKDLTVNTDVISDALYNIYRKDVNSQNAEKVASIVERTYNIDGMFKNAIHWAIPTAAVPLSAAYLYGAHQDYKRKYEGRPLKPYQEQMANTPGKIGAGAALAAVLARGVLRGKHIHIEPK